MTALRFAVLGHPNEGKSSVVSTLTENPRIRISRTPGETTQAQRYAVQVADGQDMEIIDTPGFQNPGATLTWFEAFEGSETELLPAFLAAHRDDKSFHHDLELLQPLIDGAAILYVVDPSRPLREPDRQEMELLRLTGLPRMALLNTKDDNDAYVDDWSAALNRRFNLVRPFNAHKATFPERMDLLEALALLNPDQAASIRTLRQSLIREWGERLDQATWQLMDLIERAVHLEVRERVNPEKSDAEQKEAVKHAYPETLRQLESRARKEWCRMFHHQPIDSTRPLPEGVADDLFAKRVWSLLGLSRRQIAGAGFTTGAALGAGIDLAAGGITFGVFAAGGALLGGLGGWTGGPKLGAKRNPLPGKKSLAKEEWKVGPLQESGLLFVLIDRSLLYLHHLMNWAHARRDQEAFLDALRESEQFTRDWTDAERRTVLNWFKAQRKNQSDKQQRTTADLSDLLHQKLRTPMERLSK